MLMQILKREMRDHLMSLRLILTLSLVLILMVANALMFNGEYKRQLADFNVETNRNLAELARAASSPNPLFSVFSFGRQHIQRRPNPAAFLAEGHEKDLPNSFAVNAFKLEGPAYTQRGNPVLWRFDSLDWAFIISVILSFAAIVLVYDSVNGEKERGTLRLTMSNPVPREKVLLGKYLSSVIVLLVPLVTGALLSLIILAAGGSIQLDWDLAAKVGATLLMGVLYVSLFALMGLLLSTLTRVPAISLVTGLLIWVTLVIVIPAAGNLLARGLVKVPLQDRVQEDADRASEETRQNYDRVHPHPSNWIMSGNWSPGEPLLRALEAGRAFRRAIQQYEDLLVNQTLLGQKIARVSPAELLSEGLEEISESGLFHYRKFLDRVRRYPEELANFLNQKFPFDKEYPLDRSTTDPVLTSMKLDFEAIPKFEDRFAPGVEAAGQALGKAGILALLNLLLFAGAYVSFLRYDVR